MCLYHLNLFSPFLIIGEKGRAPPKWNNAWGHTTGDKILNHSLIHKLKETTGSGKTYVRNPPPKILHSCHHHEWIPHQTYVLNGKF